MEDKEFKTLTDSKQCPFCGKELELDMEYMMEHYAEAWDVVPEDYKVYYCDVENEGCGEAGSYEEMLQWAKRLG